MRATVIILCVFVLFTHCTENESQNIILPKLLSASISLVERGFPNSRVEIIGKFNDGQDPVREIKIAWGGYVGLDRDQRSLSMIKSAELLDLHTFKIELEIESFGSDYVAFYFISENTAVYSETYLLSFIDKEPALKQVYPK